jgi:hypothetical protein
MQSCTIYVGALEEDMLMGFCLSGWSLHMGLDVYNDPI